MVVVIRVQDLPLDPYREVTHNGDNLGISHRGAAVGLQIPKGRSSQASLMLVKHKRAENYLKSISKEKLHNHFINS